jgi:hypothetical protein
MIALPAPGDRPSRPSRRRHAALRSRRRLRDVGGGAPFCVARLEQRVQGSELVAVRLIDDGA